MDPINHNNLKIAAINVNSIGKLKRRCDLQMFIDRYEIDICLISETKLNEKHRVQLSNHQLVRTDRPNSTKGGGTAIAIHNKIKFLVIHYPNLSNNKVIEFTAIKIKSNSKTNLIIISIYAIQFTGYKFIQELKKLMKDFNLDSSNNYYIIAGDFNSRNTSWGDTKSNERGEQLADWIEFNYLEYKTTLLSPKEPTFPKANSYLDHCLIDMRIDFTNLINGKLQTLPYDSDHLAITLTISVEECAPGLLNNLNSIPSQFNFKKANWNKFRKNILKNYSEVISIPSDRNLSIDEIDKYIGQLESKIQDSMISTIPRNKKQDDYYLKYNNKKIKRLHAYKSYLIKRQFDKIPVSLQEKIRIKLTIKRINKLLHKEFGKTVTAYWEAQIKSINFKNPHEFFPKINRMLRPRKDININTLKIPIDNRDLSTLCNSKFPELISNNEIIASDPETKLFIIGKYLESINSPRYMNIGTSTKIKVDKEAEETKKMKNNKQTFVEFSKENPAYYPKKLDDDPKFLFSYIEVSLPWRI
ncbi:Similar to RTase: Probable RNA-directed DNA polymerase from transposon BS (Drosophila melanogaster) [Cotesia congregata]|uniref:Similar to RTase: Probable RNA-directed DNA polymerase from transposon BS (Drosophila melanogaster) n=1 Tax=Cotesia congregata TaxID=51543 RepID=A0A8J2H8J5_COTCN|nr:Similar to RTase: Probable RNA-directed DNA polymerase from transposon BS (Drosophila melanogaster) [Cotesia congregata]